MSARDLWDEPGEPDRSEPRLHAVSAVVLAPGDGAVAAIFVTQARTRIIEMPASWVRGFRSPDEAVETDEECLRRLLAREVGQSLSRVVAYLGAEVELDDVETRFYLCEIEPGVPLVAGGRALDAFWGDASCAHASNYRWSEVMLLRGAAVAAGFATPPPAPWRAIRRARQEARRAAFRRHALAYAPTEPPPRPGVPAGAYDPAPSAVRAPRAPADLALLVRLEDEEAARGAAKATVETPPTNPARRRMAWGILSAATSALLAIDTERKEGGADE